MNEIYEKVKTSEHKYVGLKQFKRACEEEKISLVVLAEDADAWLKEEVKTLSEKHSLQLSVVPSKIELGKIAGISIGASVVTII